MYSDKQIHSDVDTIHSDVDTIHSDVDTIVCFVIQSGQVQISVSLHVNLLGMHLDSMKESHIGI